MKRYEAVSAVVGVSSRLTEKFALTEYRLAKSGDVVVVSLNYRLGVFGFTAHPAFEADHNGGYGLEDQRAALRWVRISSTLLLMSG